MATNPVSSLSGEALEKAKQELNEDPDGREESISELRRKIEELEGRAQLSQVIG